MRRTWSSAALALVVVSCGSVEDQRGGPGVGGHAQNTEACDAFHDVTPPESVTIRITNARLTAIYIDPECGSPYWLVANGVQRPGTLDVLAESCEDAKTKPLPCCDCEPSSMAIAPGTSWETHWPGLFFDWATMPDECYSGSAPRPCRQATAAPKGPITVNAIVWGSQLLDDPIMASKEFQNGTDTLVEIVVN